jgi:MFS family permease
VAIAIPAPFRIPLFRAWWGALQVSNAGTWMQQVAAGWLMLEATGSPAMVGLLGLAQRGPSLVLTPIGGRLADRYDRRRLLAGTFATQLVAAVGLVVMSATGHVTPTLLIALSVVGGCGQAIQYPAQLATISSLVPPASLHTAVSINSAGFNVGRIVGPALAGYLLARAGGGTIPFALNAVSFLAPIIVVRRLPLASAGARHEGATVRAGIAHARRSPALRRLITGCAVFTFAASPLTTLAPAFAVALGGGPDALGAVLAAFGAGATLGALVVMRATRRFGRSRVIPAAMAGFSVVGTLAAVAPSVTVAMPLCALAGAFWLSVFTSTNASVQLVSPDRLRGRVLALYLWALVGPMAIAGVVVGWLAEGVGIRVALVACTAPLGLYGIWGLARRVPTIDGEEPETA